MPSWLARLVREPLFHFLLSGTALFLLFRFANSGYQATPGEILVTNGTIEHLAATFARTWKRPPTQGELDGLIDDYIREEVFYREATALGLDHDDTIIRRRLRQKMEFIADDIAALAEPSDGELRSYFEQHASTYRQPNRYSFRQVYLDPTRHGENLRQEVEHLLALLADGGTRLDPADLGDRLMLPSEFHSISQGDVGASFGEEFATQLEGLPLGQWQGPVPSGYGVHLVLLEARSAGAVPQFEEVREAVQRDWANARRTQAINDLFRDRVRQYRVRIEKPVGGMAQVRR
jgi:hypothetical protein